ncbi:M23 family metallopeptidase [Paenibacillus anaericanus]|uniref:M23 family metallopeptidase n=1 Tax=Paenibacillus anaericanus TaxID=170367 RepID=A0A433XXB5_9BACL|nr:M23 family metallopeptidase [Paenibacillus anaericanus]RUT39494.1 M23 family metallopeptidase [Paenibacillus anaericanus]
MKQKRLIKITVIFFLLQVFGAALMMFVIISMAMQVVTLPQRAVSEAAEQVKEWIYGGDVDLSNIDFQIIADKWLGVAEWINPENDQKEVGIPAHVITMMQQEDLLIPPELLIAIASLKGKDDVKWIENIAYKLAPRDLVFEKIEGDEVLTGIKTYLGIYEFSYSTGKVKKVSFKENTEILDDVLGSLRLKKDKDLILSIVKSIEPGSGISPDQGSIEISGSYFAWPIDRKYRISSTFGERYHPIDKKWKLHAGTDIAVPEGTKIYAAADGIVEKSTFSKAAGNYINIKHDNGFSTRYLHLIRRNVKVGDRVKKGDLIGLSGNTGNSTGPHLHFEIRMPNGDPVDPEKFLPDIY